MHQKCLLAITGSIAAIKTPELIRCLQEQNIDVQCICTAAAQRFVTAESLAAISGNPVLSHDFFHTSSGNGILATPDFDHITLAQECDILLVAPASADTIARLVHGRSSGLIEAIALGMPSPILLAPAMNTSMYTAAVTQENIATLLDRGIQVLPTATGTLACGETGEGKMLSPQEITLSAQKALSVHDLLGKTVLITLGSTREPLDPVRYITNGSSGKMGLALARECFLRGANVRLIVGHISEDIPHIFSQIHHVSSAQQMLTTTEKHISGADIAFFTAAVSDWSPQQYSEEKISSSSLNIPCTKTPDIAQICGQNKQKHQKFYGCALQTEAGETAKQKAFQKMKKKNYDGILLNAPKNIGAHEGTALFFTKNTKQKEGEMHGTKQEMATEMLTEIIQDITKSNT